MKTGKDKFSFYFRIMSNIALNISLFLHSKLFSEKKPSYQYEKGGKVVQNQIHYSRFLLSDCVNVFVYDGCFLIMSWCDVLLSLHVPWPA